MKIYKFDNIYCSYTCGHAIVLAESRQQAMEMIVADDIVPEQANDAVAAFRTWQKEGPNAGFEISALWERILDDSNVMEFSINDPILFRCEGSD